MENTLAIEIEGPTRVRCYFGAQCSPKRALVTRKPGPLFRPGRRRHQFSFQYDPHANNGIGRITVKLDDVSFILELTAEQRAAGARFDRFGVFNPREGGKYVVLYYDDLTYPARRAGDHQPVKHQDKIMYVPYPADGRAFN